MWGPQEGVGRLTGREEGAVQTVLQVLKQEEMSAWKPHPCCPFHPQTAQEGGIITSSQRRKQAQEAYSTESRSPEAGAAARAPQLLPARTVCLGIWPPLSLMVALGPQLCVSLSSLAKGDNV